MNPSPQRGEILQVVVIPPETTPIAPSEKGAARSGGCLSVEKISRLIHNENMHEKTDRVELCTILMLPTLATMTHGS